MSHVDDGALHAYLDGELSSVERARLEAHVAECPACRARLDEERGLIERASHLLGLAQPPERAAPPLHQLRQPRLLWRLRMPLAWAATVVLAVSLGYYAGGMTVARAPAPADFEDSSANVAMAAPEEAPAPAPRRTAPARPSERQRLDEIVVTGVEQQKDKANAPVIVVDGSVPAPRRDSALPSAAAGAGAVAIRPPEPRPVAAAPAADVMEVRREADVAALRGRAVTTEWPIIRRDPARQLLGTDPVGVPGLAVRDMRRSPAGDAVVLVEQVVDSTTVIQLFQRRAAQLEVASGVVAREGAAAARAPAAAPQQRSYAGTERLARFIGPLRVEIAGPLSSDSLNKLLEQLKPLP